MTIDSELKPLFANLKRVKIGKYLNSKEFEYFTIENDFDELWNDCKKEVRNKFNVVIIGHHDTEDDEEAFAYLMSQCYNQYYDSFGEFITTVLLNFARWNSIKLDFTSVYHNLKQLGLLEKNLLAFIKESRRIRDSKPEKVEEINDNKKEVKRDKKKVFIVHGHDNEAKSKTARLVEKLGFKAIILHEQASSSKTIIEKIEEYSNVGFGIVLYTPCDLGAKKTDNVQLKPRARQNVVFEHGFLIGKIGRGNVCALVKGQLETPNDISGVVYIDMNDTDSWKYSVAKEMKEAGYNVDMNLI